MTPSAIIRAVAAVVALAMAGWLGWTLYKAGSAEQRADTAVAAVQQAAVSAETGRTLQAKVDETNAKLRKLEASRAATRKRLDAAEQRLRDDPNAGAAAAASLEALRDYAQEVERDFAECRAAVAALADEAAGASDAAHALSDAWPAVEDWNRATRAWSAASQGLTK